MAIANRFYIKVDSNDSYSSSGSYKNLQTIHTKNGKTISLPSSIWHPVLKSLNNSGNENPYGYIGIVNTEAQAIGFINGTYNINFDRVADPIDENNWILSRRLYKSNIDYPLMHPYMAKVLESFLSGKSWQNLSGSFSLNKYGEVNGRFSNAGVIQIQGAGGGGGGTNNVSADCAGGGGGGGGYACIYYRIKSDNVSLSASVGSGGSAGGGGTTWGGTGSASEITFNTPSGSYNVKAMGGAGGATGDYDYANGGSGGNVFVNGSVVASGGTGGTSSVSPATGSRAGGSVVVNNNYLFIYLFHAQGGAGGGRGDDTNGSAVGQNGASSTSAGVYTPVSFGNAYSFTHSAKSGGSKGATSTRSNSGGGGASVLANGGAGGGVSGNGTAGTQGAGGGGAGVGGNANRNGSRGGDGIIWILQ